MPCSPTKLFVVYLLSCEMDWLQREMTGTTGETSTAPPCFSVFLRVSLCSYPYLSVGVPSHAVIVPSIPFSARLLPRRYSSPPPPPFSGPFASEKHPTLLVPSPQKK